MRSGKIGYRKLEKMRPCMTCMRNVPSARDGDWDQMAHGGSWGRLWQFRCKGCVGKGKHLGHV